MVLPSVNDHHILVSEPTEGILMCEISEFQIVINYLSKFSMKL